MFTQVYVSKDDDDDTNEEDEEEEEEDEDEEEEEYEPKAKKSKRKGKENHGKKVRTKKIESKFKKIVICCLFSLYRKGNRLPLFPPPAGNTTHPS